jgi:pyrroline-5-carboxylate reductase
MNSLVFIGGGNMATAIVGGLLRAGQAAAAITIVEPWAEQRARLAAAFPDVRLLAGAEASLARAELVVWAVKPQQFGEAAAPCKAFVGGALQLSIMAGVTCATVAAASGAASIVRAMPNTPALIGQGITGLFATTAVSGAQRQAAEQALAPTGSLLWVAQEADLDAVTALSGSGPAYVFYFLEAMVDAGVQMGLPQAQARRFAQETFAGAAQLAMRSDETPAVLRERVTSKGGTTYAAISALDEAGVKAAFMRALHAAQQRSAQLGAASAAL